MLPYPREANFPQALKARRELRGMSRADLAAAAGVHKVMIRRYEEPDCGEFTRPRPDSTWLALNRALGYEIPEDIQQFIETTESIYKVGLFDSGPLDPNDHLGWDTGVDDDGVAAASNGSESGDRSIPAGLLLKDASLEDIVKLLHSRNIEPTFRHLLAK